MARGKIVEFDPLKGYGLIAPDDGGADVFVHADDLGRQDVDAGTPVRFSSIQGVRGLKAYNVMVLTAQPDQRGTLRVPGSYRDNGTSLGYFDDDDHFAESLGSHGYEEEVTDVLVSTIPEATVVQIVEARRRLVMRAARHGWIAGLADHFRSAGFPRSG